MRGGLRPNDRAGKPRRGRRSREHRLETAFNGAMSSTDARSEQRSEVAGSRLSEDAPNGLMRTVRAPMGAPRYHPFSGFGRSLDLDTASVAPRIETMSKRPVGDAGANNEAGRRVPGHEGRRKAGAKAELELARAKPTQAETAREHRTPRGVTAGRVGKALKAVTKPQGRMWRETKPRGPGGLKPLRG